MGQPHFRKGGASPPFWDKSPLLQIRVSFPFLSLPFIVLPFPLLYEMAAKSSYEVWGAKLPQWGPPLGRKSILVYLAADKCVRYQPFWFFLWEPKCQS